MDFQEYHEAEYSPLQMPALLHREATREYTASPQSILAHLGLAELSTYRNASVEQLLEALRDARWERRASAATALRNVHPSIPIDPLVEALKDDYEEVRAAAARTLGSLGKAAPVAVMIRALDDPSALVREAVTTAIGNVGLTVPTTALLTVLKDEDEAVRAAAAYALGRIGASSSTLLKDVLDDPCILVREAAAIALGQLATADARLLLITHVMKEEEALVRDALTEAVLNAEQPLTQQFVQIALQTETTLLQKMAGKAINALVDLGRDIHAEISPDIPLRRSSFQIVNKNAQKAVTIYLIGRAFEVLSNHISLAPLVELLCLGQQDPTIQEGVWKILQSFAQRVLQERKRIHMLFVALFDHDKSVCDEVGSAMKWLARLAFELLQEQISAEALQKRLEHASEKQQLAIWRYLIGKGLSALDEREGLDPLFTALGDPDAQIKVSAAQALHKRVKKAYMGRVPGGALIISLKRAQEATPLEFQFGLAQEQVPKEGRIVLPGYESALNEKPTSEVLRSLNILSLSSILGNVCCT